MPVTLVGQAIQANDPEGMVKFVLGHPKQAESASVEEKIQMLKIIAANCKIVGDTSMAQRNREQASFIILKNEEGHPASLAEMANGVGRPWIEKNIRAWKNADL